MFEIGLKNFFWVNPISLGPFHIIDILVCQFITLILDLVGDALDCEGILCWTI